MLGHFCFFLIVNITKADDAHRTHSIVMISAPSTQHDGARSSGHIHPENKNDLSEITGMAATEANNPMIIRAFIVLYIDMLINDLAYRERQREGEREVESPIYDRCENQIIYQLNYWQTLRCALDMKRSLSL